MVAYIESTPLIDISSNDVIGVRTQRFKYFRDKLNPKERIHLYDIQNDPVEEKNLASLELKKVKEMEELLLTITKDSSETSNPVNDDDNSLIEEELKKMGYV